MCIFSHCVGTRNQQKLILLKNPKNPEKNPKNPKKPYPYPRKGQTRIGFFWVTPPTFPSHYIILKFTINYAIMTFIFW